MPKKNQVKISIYLIIKDEIFELKDEIENLNDKIKKLKDKNRKLKKQLKSKRNKRQKV